MKQNLGIKTIYGIAPLQKMLRETTYKCWSDEVAKRTGLPSVSVHGDKTSGLTLTYNVLAANNLRITEDTLRQTLLDIITPKGAKRTTDALLSRSCAALQVVALTAETKAYLQANDPKALEQVEGVIKELTSAGVKSDPRA